MGGKESKEADPRHRARAGTAPPSPSRGGYSAPGYGAQGYPPHQAVTPPSAPLPAGGVPAPAPNPYMAGAPAAPPPAANPYMAGGGAAGPPAVGAASITVAQLNGSKTPIDIPLTTTVAGLKLLLSQRLGVAVPQQRLVFSGRQLDDAQQLQSYGVTKGCTVHLVLRKAKGDRKPGLQDLLDAYEVSVAAAADLEALARYDIVFLVDDSGSMNQVEVTNGVRQSRWQEMRDTLGALIEFATYFDDDGTDVYFLNRPPIEGVTDSKDERLQRCFAQRPSGTTPLTSRFRELAAKRAGGAKPLLIVMATDGQPDTGPADFVQAARQVMGGRADVRLAVMACTQDDRAVRWLNQLDDDPQIGSKVDVCDDYESERREVLQTGKVRQFLISDYYVKALLGPILSKYDNFDKR
eukprot:TRINITY_DN9614_c0_g1_i1.p1 TRINITY_DN9614_c0_g1~~TRINITY_DN9614_c0_g1_i1.p1  ORF type:complete len:433 (+),score=140.89 TRINITY_DN9614_c0_g1_i1:77-1300(+)